jgi:hypothetical protein
LQNITPRIQFNISVLINKKLSQIWGGKIFSLQPVQEVIFPGIRQRKREASLSLPSDAEVKKLWSISSAPLYTPSWHRVWL